MCVSAADRCCKTRADVQDARSRARAHTQIHTGARTHSHAHSRFPEIVYRFVRFPIGKQSHPNTKIKSRYDLIAASSLHICVAPFAHMWVQLLSLLFLEQLFKVKYIVWRTACSMEISVNFRGEKRWIKSDRKNPIALNTDFGLSVHNYESFSIVFCQKFLPGLLGVFQKSLDLGVHFYCAKIILNGTLWEILTIVKKCNQVFAV